MLHYRAGPCLLDVSVLCLLDVSVRCLLDVSGPCLLDVSGPCLLDVSVWCLLDVSVRCLLDVRQHGTSRCLLDEKPIVEPHDWRKKRVRAALTRFDEVLSIFDEGLYSADCVVPGLSRVATWCSFQIEFVSLTQIDRLRFWIGTKVRGIIINVVYKLIRFASVVERGFHVTPGAAGGI